MVKKLTLTALYFRAFTFPFRPIEFAVRGQALGKKQVQNIQKFQLWLREKVRD